MPPTHFPTPAPASEREPGISDSCIPPSECQGHKEQTWSRLQETQGLDGGKGLGKELRAHGVILSPEGRRPSWNSELESTGTKCLWHTQHLVTNWSMRSQQGRETVTWLETGVSIHSSL